MKTKKSPARATRKKSVPKAARRRKEAAKRPARRIRRALTLGAAMDPSLSPALRSKFMGLGTRWAHVAAAAA